MLRTYGVVWHEEGKPLARGKLELLPLVVRLDGMTGSQPTRREIAYESLTNIHIGRSASERIQGRTSLVLAPEQGEPVSIASVAESGVVAELAERLTALQVGARRGRAVAVVLPLKTEAHKAVRTLLAEGPPFDAEALGLERHQVFLTDSEAVFVFESHQGAAALEALLKEPRLWQSAAAWHLHLAEPPRIAEGAYSWKRPEASFDPSLLPPGLRDSRNGH